MSKSGSKDQRAPIEAPDSLQSIAYAKILDVVSEGEIYGFADQDHPLTCVFLNETPVGNADGSLNFNNVQIDSRVGTQYQDPYNGFEGVESEIAVGVELKQVTPWTQAFTNLNLTTVRVRLSVAALSNTDVSNGDIKGYSVGYKIEIGTDGGGLVKVLQSAFTGKTGSKFERSHDIELPPATSTGWIIRVTRLSPDTESATIQDTTFVESYTEIVAGKFRMPMTASVATVVDSQQFNQIPSRAFHLKGRILQVPSNYNAATRVYTGVWDGTFQPAYSNNPAWVFYDMATNPRYGLGHLVAASVPDKWALYNIAQYCDELVDDGFGGLEPRFTCNLYMQEQNDALRVMLDLASVFRGICYVSGSSIMAVADMPSDPMFTYTPANVIGGKFNYPGSGRKTRHTVALVSWNDMTDFCRAKLEYVEDKAGIARYGIQPTEVIAVGCTSRGQAHRMGKYILATERFETDGVVFDVGLDGMIPAPGRIVEIADPLRAGKRMGGRISAADLDTITVDAVPDVLEVGDSITAMVMVPVTGMARQTRPVSSIVGNAVNVSPAFTGVPIAQSVWLIEKDELVAQKFRVLGVLESSDGVGYNIVGIQHVDGKFDYVENDIAINEQPISMLPSTLPSVPTVTLTTFQRFGHGTAFNVLNADWPDLDNAVSYNIQWRKDNGPWSETLTKPNSQDEWEGAFAGVYQCRVWGINSRGLPGPIGLSLPVTVGDAVLPIVDLDIVGGVVTIDCRYMQFRLLLDEDVTSVVFINGAPQDTLLIEVTQASPGEHTMAFGTNVIPVSGKPYVPTPTVGAIDILGLTTNNGGITWALLAQQPTASDGASDPLIVVISPKPASNSVTTNGVTSVYPSVAVTSTATGGTDPKTHSWERADGLGGANFAISDATSANPTFSIAAGTTPYNATQIWRDTVTAAFGVTAQDTVEVTLQRIVESLLASFDAKVAETYGTGTTGPTGGAVWFYFKRDGTWEAWGSVESNGIGYPASMIDSGNWHGAPTSTIGDEYKIRFTVTGGTGGSYSATGSGSFSNLSSTCVCQLSYTRNTSGSHTVSRNVTVRIEKISDASVNVSGGVELIVTGDNS